MCLSEKITTSSPNTTITSANSFALPFPSRISWSVCRLAWAHKLKNDFRHSLISNRSDSLTPSASDISKTPNLSELDIAILLTC
ncbi:hypothetical protein EMIT0P44_170029 [Pseudomonas sp. IT-P44]